MSQLPDMRRCGPPGRNEMEPPPREFPPSARPTAHERSAYIPQESRDLSHRQTSDYIPPANSVDLNRIFSHYPPPVARYRQQNQPLPPPQVLHQDPPNVFQGTNPTPTFLRPPPDFSRPPPSFIRPPQVNEGNIPVSSECQAVFSAHNTGSMITAQNTSHSWHRDLLPPAGNFQSLPQISRDSVYGNLDQSGPSETQEEEDQKWLKEFEKRIKKCQASQPRKIESMKRTIKLIDLEKMVLESQTLADSLCQLEGRMKLEESSAEEAVWQDMVHQVEHIKMKLSELIVRFQDKTFIGDVKELIYQRRLKRKRLKRRKKDLQLEKEEHKKARQEEEEKIDAWREKLKMEGEEKRREKAIKAEADGILGEVRQKQSETLRMQQLLESLITLRLTRTNKGHTSTPQNDQHFASKIKEISEVVEKQMKEYELEEQTLRVMMEESASHQCSIAGRELSAFTRREAAIKKVLFGDYCPLDVRTTDALTAADQSLDVLLKRRCEWDRFITEDDTPLSSSIPLHWVVPPDCPTPSWAQFQNQ